VTALSREGTLVEPSGVMQTFWCDVLWAWVLDTCQCAVCLLSSLRDVQCWWHAHGPMRALLPVLCGPCYCVTRVTF
jgi:hypothetical protein